MKCPYCSNEMTRGKIQARGGGGLYWLPENEKIMITISDSKIQKKQGIVLVSTNTIGAVVVPAFICKPCRKIVIEY